MLLKLHLASIGTVLLCAAAGCAPAADSSPSTADDNEIRGSSATQLACSLYYVEDLPQDQANAHWLISAQGSRTTREIAAATDNFVEMLHDARVGVGVGSRGKQIGISLHEQAPSNRDLGGSWAVLDTGYRGSDPVLIKDVRTTPFSQGGVVFEWAHLECSLSSTAPTPKVDGSKIVDGGPVGDGGTVGDGG